jgi:hypothetical protein
MVPIAALPLVVFGLSPVGPGLAPVFPKFTFLGIHLVLLFFPAVFLLDAWRGVSSLSVVLEHRLS